MNQRQCALVELERRKDKVPRLKNRPARDRPTTDQRACDSFFSPILGITPKHSGIRSEKLSDLSHTIFGSAPVLLYSGQCPMGGGWGTRRTTDRRT